MIRISSSFDGGNILCDTCADASDIQLQIKTDSAADFSQWFYFRLTGGQGLPCVMKITNADKASYVKGWEGYQAVASYDRENWFRVDTVYENGHLVIRHTPDVNAVYYAYFAPYSMERHSDLIADAGQSPDVFLSVLGETLDGQDMDLLTIGEPAPEKKAYWLVARQHPGETMAEWWMEGFLSRLLDEDDAVSRALLEKICFYVVPNMNPDGSRRGHLRTNAAGANLNREWSEPEMNKSPEVYLVRQKMQSTGVDFCLDVHGDEGLPYNFIAGTQGIPSWTAEKDRLLTDFKRLWQQVNPDFQTTHGYPAAPKGKGNLAMCGNYVAETFGCLAMTLEMPFKDTADTPNELWGWSPERSKKFGASVIDVLHQLDDRLTLPTK
ncbi:MAG: M14-type cytosolic carboxypeptidase [Sneathiella sp.]|uniref:M14 family metallopeptidase n=1 Tax=Sneathiella sp. TaxID=1964365 RepID=UPI003001E631